MDILTGERSTKQKLEYRYLRTINEQDRVTVPAGADEDLFPGVAEVSLPGPVLAGQVQLDLILAEIDRQVYGLVYYIMRFQCTVLHGLALATYV